MFGGKISISPRVVRLMKEGEMRSAGKTGTGGGDGSLEKNVCRRFKLGKVGRRVNERER